MTRASLVSLSVLFLTACGESTAATPPPESPPELPVVEAVAPVTPPVTPESAHVEAAPNVAIIHCDMSDFMGSCEEHPASNTELQGTCEGIGGTFAAGPCPTAGRIGHCECATPECAAAGVAPMFLYAPRISTDELGQTMCGQLRFVRD